MPEMAALTECRKIARIPIDRIMVQVCSADDHTNPPSARAIPAGRSVGNVTHAVAPDVPLVIIPLAIRQRLDNLQMRPVTGLATPSRTSKPDLGADRAPLRTVVMFQRGRDRHAES
jgi:hypothetical protein